MDSKQTRSTIPHDENAVSLFPRRSLHSRTKSSPSLGDLAATGSSRATSRGALGDISQTTRGNRLLAEPARAGRWPREEKENANAGQYQASFLPHNTSLLAFSGDSTQDERLPRVVSKRATTIFRDYSTLPQVTESTVAENTHDEEVASQNAELTEQEEEILEENLSLQPGNEQSLGLGNDQQVEELTDLQFPETTLEELEEYSANQVALALTTLENNRQSVQETLASANEILSNAFQRHNEAIENRENFPFVPITNEENNTIELYATEEHELVGDDEYVTATSIQGQTEIATEENWTATLLPEPSLAANLELEDSKMAVAALSNPVEVENEEWDIAMVADYKEEIFEYYREVEARLAPCPSYMDTQPEIQWTMRSVLIDWIVQVHERFQLFPETLFLTVNIIDRFLSVKVVSMNKLQLVGATALFVAGKYEEVNGPSLKEIVFMVDGTYEEDEILKAERFMLSLLGFELGWPGPMSFLRRISTADDYDLETRTAAKYFLELTIMDEKFLECPPSLLAAGAHCLSRMMLGKGHWSYAHVHYSGYTYEQLLPLLESLLDCLDNPQEHHAAIFEKYSHQKFRHAATFAQQEMRGGFHLLDPLTNSVHNRNDLSQRYRTLARLQRLVRTPAHEMTGFNELGLLGR